MITPLRNAKLQTDLDADGHTIQNLGGIGARLYDVKTYGATGDGTTDDTAAIQAALAAIPSEGGTLYFPTGIYKYTGSTLALSKPITVRGDGAGTQIISGGIAVAGFRALSTIDFNSSTVSLFTVSTNGCAFLDIGMRNVSGSTPSAGAGITVTSGGDRTLYQNILVHGFYIGIDAQNGMAQTWDGCYITAPVLYGIKLQHIAVPDGGDHFISNCYIYGGLERAFTSGIRIESGGGVKIVNTKINGMTNAAMTNCIDLAVAASVITVDLLVSNCSLESFSAYGIKCRIGAGAVWKSILITGNQISPFVSGNPRGISIDGAGGGGIDGVMLTGNHGLATPSSTNSFIDLANVTNVSIIGNNQIGYGALITVGSGVTFARSAAIPTGGTTGQSLKKLSNADYDVGWG